jgi:hypothetical protein
MACSYDSIKPSLKIFMVGTFAAVLRKKDPDSDYFTAVRILLPKTLATSSLFNGQVAIPGSVPFIGIPSNVQPTSPAEPLLRKLYSFPYMEDAGEAATSPIEVSFYKLEKRRPLVIRPKQQSSAAFRAHFGQNVNTKERPTRENACYLDWSPRMEEYSKENHVVHNDYLADWVRKDAAFGEFDFGTLSVARMSFDHRFRFINGNDEFERAIADTLKLETVFDDEQTRTIIEINDDLTFEAKGALSLVIGSEPLEDLADYEFPRPCGEPYYHHELLYRFSASPPEGPRDVATPVCLNVDHVSKDPRVGGCIPHALMTDPGAVMSPAAVSAEAATAISGKRGALSLHLGVNEFAENFPSTIRVDPLKSCVTDARKMSELAAAHGFQALNGPGSNVLTDSMASRRNVVDALKAYGEALDEGGFFILTMSGHGYPAQSRNLDAGWCLNTGLLPYAELRKLLANHFPTSARVMVVCDCCHARAPQERANRIKQVSFAFAQEAFRFQFKVNLFDTEFTARLRGELPGPTTYFVFACGANETTEDGPDRESVSPFTGCVIQYADERGFANFESKLKMCSRRDSAIGREPREEEWEALGPFRVPRLTT